MEDFHEGLSRSRKIVMDAVAKSESFIFFSIVDNDTVVGSTVGSDRAHANLLISLAARDPGFAELLIRVGAEVEKKRVVPFGKN
ncbi:MAG: hypothetical protein M9904_02470 [Chitinophagaceae bacterium]|nr:hypothetical protein [Chitinophagaceae bacterium]